MKLYISRTRESFRHRFFDQDINFLLSKTHERVTMWVYFLYAVEVFFEPMVKMVQFISDIVTVVKLIVFNKSSNQKYFKSWVPFSVSKWIYITTIPLTLSVILYKIVQSVLLIKATNNIMLVYLNTSAKKMLTMQKDISVYLIFKKIQKSAKSKEHTKFNRLCFFTWEQLHNWPFIICNSPKQIINALTLWSLFVSKNQKNLKELNSLSNVILKIKRIGEYNKSEAVILFGMLLSLVSYCVLAVVFLVGVLSLLYIENRLLAADSRFKNRWIPFFREEGSSLKEYISIQLLANLEQQTLESELMEKNRKLKKQWLDITSKKNVKNHIKTPSRIYKYV